MSLGDRSIRKVANASVAPFVVRIAPIVGTRHYGAGSVAGPSAAALEENRWSNRVVTGPATSYDLKDPPGVPVPVGHYPSMTTRTGKGGKNATLRS